MPWPIKASLASFAAAFGCEAIVLIVMLYHFSLPWAGYLPVLAALIANPMAIRWAFKGETRGYTLLKWIAAFTILWMHWGDAYLHALGLWAIALIGGCAWLRVLAMVLMRRKVAKAWINTNTLNSANSVR